jgi:hypothetical protein
VSPTGRIRIDGLREFQAALRRADKELLVELKTIFSNVTDTVIKYAEPKIPRDSGAAVASVKRRIAGREAKVAIGGRKAPYYPWLDFGGQGRVKGRPGRRPFVTEGRYLYPALRVKRDDIIDEMSAGMAALARRAGLDVTSG